MSKRYALEIHLVEVDEAGKTVETLEIRKTDDVTTDLKGLKQGSDYLRETLGNVMYDHLDDYTLLTNRETGEVTYPDADEDDEEDDEAEMVFDCAFAYDDRYFRYFAGLDDEDE